MSETTKVSVHLSPDDFQFFMKHRNKSHKSQPDGLRRNVRRCKKKGYHPFLAAIRAYCEAIALDYAVAEGRPVVDFGANVLRHSINSPKIFEAVADQQPLLQFCVPIYMDGDLNRQRKALSLAPERTSLEMLDDSTVSKYVGITPLFIHSAYYIDVEVLHKLLAANGCAYMVVHAFREGERGTAATPKDLTVKHGVGPKAVNREEATYWDEGGKVAMMVKKNQKPYRHSYPDWSGVVQDTMFEYSVGDVTWMRVVRISPVQTKPQVQPRSPTDGLVQRIGRHPVNERTGVRAAHEIAEHGTRNKMTPTEVESLIPQVMDDAAKLSEAMQNSVIQSTGGWYELLMARVIRLTSATHGRSAARLNALHVASFSSSQRSTSTSDGLRSGLVFATGLCTNRFSLAIIGLGAMWVAADNPKTTSRLLNTLVPRAVSNTGAHCFALLYNAASSLAASQAAKCSVLDALGTSVVYRESKYSVCAGTCTMPPGLTFHSPSPQCDKTENFGYQPYGLGLPVDPVVIHDCPFTQARAISTRVLDPYTAVDEPSFYSDVCDTMYLRYLESTYVVISSSEWLEKYSGLKRERKCEGLFAPESIFEAGGLVKRELTGKGSYPRYVPTKASVSVRACIADPRWITTRDASISGKVGPHMHSLSKFLMRHHDCSVDDAPGLRLVYAVGYNAEEHGALRNRAIAYVSETGPVTHLEGDFSRYDARLQVWQNDREAEFLGRLSGDPELAQWLVSDLLTTNVVTKHLRTRWSGRRRSGDDCTSVFNTMAQLRYWYVVWQRARSCGADGRCVVFAAGDDSYVTINTELEPLFIACALEISQIWGWKIVFAETPHPGFNSGIYVPGDVIETRLGPASSVLTPKPGRAWAKASCCTRNYNAENLADWAATNAIGNTRSWHSVPVLRVLCREWSDAGKYNEDYAVPGFQYEREHISEVNWEFWEEYYSCSKSGIEAFESIISRDALTPRVVMPHEHDMVLKLVAESGFPLLTTTSLRWTDTGLCLVLAHPDTLNTPVARSLTLRDSLSVYARATTTAVVEELVLQLVSRRRPARLFASGLLVAAIETPTAAGPLGLGPALVLKTATQLTLSWLRHRSPCGALAAHVAWNLFWVACSDSILRGAGES